MGMAASQARFLSLVARKNNVEYEGQQINQQRTALSNASASHYTDLLGMAVPVCPSVEDFTQTVYSFEDGALTNSITSLIAQGDGSYKVSYLSRYTDDFAIVSAGATSIVNTASGKYMVGADELKGLAQDLDYAYVINEGFSKYRLYEDGDNFNYTDVFGVNKTLIPTTDTLIKSVIGPKPNIDDYIRTNSLVNNYIATTNQDIEAKTGIAIPQCVVEQLYYSMCADGTTSVTYNNNENSSDLLNGHTLTITELNKSLIYATNKPAPTQEQKDFQTLIKTTRPDLYQRMINLYIKSLVSVEKAYNAQSAKYCELTTPDNVIVWDENHVDNAYVNRVGTSDYNQIKAEWRTLWADIENATTIVDTEGFNRDTATWQANYNRYAGNYVDADDYTKVYTLKEKEIFYDGDDEYLNSLSADQLKALAQTEIDYKEMLNEKMGESENGWYVRYVQNSSTGEWEPIFYNGDDLAEGILDDHSNIRSEISAYKIGSKKVQNEVKGVDAMLEQDSTGRYINISFIDGGGNSRTYALTTSTVTDNDAYNDAMNQYEYDKALYEQGIEEINAKIAIIQAEDKNLELRLKQLDTEHNAIDNEMDAVSKVVEKHVESSFKTFG